MTLLKAGWTAFGTYKTCLKNIDVGRPCLSSDADNIRAILKEVQDLSAKVDANHKEVVARLHVLQRSIDTTTLDGYVSSLRPEALNGRKALMAWERLAICMKRATKKLKTCPAPGGAWKKLKPAVAEWKRDLITQADLTSANVEVTRAEFTGTADRNGENGLAFSAWILNKRVQDAQAGVTDAGQLASKTAPVITRQLERATNFFIDYYEEVLQTYGFIKPLAEGLKGRPKVAQNLQRRVLEEIYGKGEYSAARVTKRMRLPRLAPRQLLYLKPSGAKALIVADAPIKQGTLSLLTPEGVFQLGRALNAYGKAESLRATNPGSFPYEGWYSAHTRIATPKVCPRNTTWCSSYSNLYRNEYTVNQLMRSGGLFREVGMRPLNARPGWNSAWSQPDFGVMGINFRREYDHFVTGPAEYDWDIREWGGNGTIYYTRKSGPGAWVKIHHGKGNFIYLTSIPYLMGGPR